MIYDLLILLVLFLWAFGRIIDKSIIKYMDPKEFAKWFIVVDAILVLPLIFFIKPLTLNPALILIIVAIFWIVEMFFKLIAVKREELSRLYGFSHFKLLFAILLAFIILKEPLSLNTILGGTALIFGGILISLEKKYKDIKKFTFSNLAVLIFLISMLAAAFSLIASKFLLNTGVTAVNIVFYSTIFAAVMVAPTIKSKIKKKILPRFILAKFLLSYGYLLFLWVLSKQDLVFIVPLLAIDPLIMLILSKKILKEAKTSFYQRMFGIFFMIIGYLILKGYIF